MGSGPPHRRAPPPPSPCFFLAIDWVSTLSPGTVCMWLLAAIRVMLNCPPAPESGDSHGHILIKTISEESCELVGSDVFCVSSLPPAGSLPTLGVADWFSFRMPGRWKVNAATWPQAEMRPVLPWSLFDVFALFAFLRVTVLHRRCAFG